MHARRFETDETTASVVFAASSSVHQIRSVGSVSGWIEVAVRDDAFAADQALEGHLEVPLNGLSSGNPLIDREMKRRVDSGVHPAINANIEETLRVDGNRATITGTIDFLGASTLVEGEVVVLPGPRLVGTGEFDVRWWGLEPPGLLMLRVDPIITVQIDAPLIERLRRRRCPREDSGLRVRRPMTSSRRNVGDHHEEHPSVGCRCRCAPGRVQRVPGRCCGIQS